MAKNDYFVLAYRVLKYLYACLKKGEAVNNDLLKPDALNINAKYCQYLLGHLESAGYLTGVYEDGGAVYLGEVQITPKGIEYLMTGEVYKKYDSFCRLCPALSAIGTV